MNMKTALFGVLGLMASSVVAQTDTCIDFEGFGAGPVSGRARLFMRTELSWFPGLI
jgi:hypothetical protein